MAKKKKEFYEDDLGHLSFKDSWLQNTVQVAALGGILAGAGALAVHGDLGETFRNNKSAFQPLGKAFDKYVKENAKLPLKFGYQVFKRMFGNLQKLTPEEKDAAKSEFRSMVENAADKVDTDPVIKKRIRKEVKKRFGTGGKDGLVDDVLDGTNNFEDMNDADRIRTIYEQVRGEERDRLINGTPFGNQNQRSYGNNNGYNNNNNKPLFNKKDLAQKFIANGVAGLGLGAGLTGFHYIDRLSKDPHAQHRLENAYHRAGSFLNPPKKDDDKKMNKQASALGFYNAVKDAPKKLPEALFAGAGYTGVTLGTAKLLKKNQNQQQPTEQEKPTGPRVIIELGNEPSTNQEHHNMGMPLGLSGLPKLAGLGNFWNDFKGHEAEIENMRNMNHSDMAAETLRNEDVDGLLNKQYGNLVNDHTRANFTNRLFESRADQSKREADEKIRQLEEQTAKARLTAGGGALGATSLAGMGYAHYQKEQKQHV